MNDIPKSEIKLKWNEYSNAYNELSDIIDSLGIDVMLLKKVVDTFEIYMNSCRSLCPSDFKNRI